MAERPERANTDDIDYRTRVGSDAWKARHNKSTKQLSAWRRLHMMRPHDEITKRAKPTDPPEKLVKLIKEFKEEDKK